MPPRILLIGAGRFGREHLAEWRRLDAQGEATLAGVVTRANLGPLHGSDAGVAVHAELSDALLRDVDAVDIVTPPHTHAALVRRCLPFAHVLVEKPLATSPEEAAGLVACARANGHVLAVGHLFRFHPVVHELARVVPSGGIGRAESRGASSTQWARVRGGMRLISSSCTCSTSSMPSSASSRRSSSAGPRAS